MTYLDILSERYHWGSHWLNHAKEQNNQSGKQLLKGKKSIQTASPFVSHEGENQNKKENSPGSMHRRKEKKSAQTGEKKGKKKQHSSSSRQQLNKSYLNLLIHLTSSTFVEL
jgi:ABC-type lipoprotein release transport system permease subunit